MLNLDQINHVNIDCEDVTLLNLSNLTTKKCPRSILVVYCMYHLQFILGFICLKVSMWMPGKQNHVNVSLSFFVLLTALLWKEKDRAQHLFLLSRPKKSHFISLLGGYLCERYVCTCMYVCVHMHLIIAAIHL